MSDELDLGVLRERKCPACGGDGLDAPWDAHCDAQPDHDLILKLCDALDACRQERDRWEAVAETEASRFKSALMFYADSMNWVRGDVESDGGARAFAALMPDLSREEEVLVGIMERCLCGKDNAQPGEPYIRLDIVCPKHDIHVGDTSTVWVGDYPAPPTGAPLR